MAAGAALTMLAAFGRPAFAVPGSLPVHLAAAFGALPRVSGVALSRSGRMLAWIRRQGSQRSVVVYSYAAHRVQRVFNIDPRMRPQTLRWDGSDILLVGVDMTIQPLNGWHSPRYTISRTLALNIASGHTQLLLMSGNEREYVSNAILLRVDPHRRHSVIMFTYQWSANAYRSGAGTLIHNAVRDSGWVVNLFAVDPDTGAYKVIGYGNGFTTGWVVNIDGEPVARCEYHPRHRYFLIEAARGSGWVTIYRHTGNLLPQVQSVSRDGKSIVAIVPDGSGVQHLWAVPVDGTAPQELLPGVRRPVLSIDTSRSGRLLGVALGGGRRRFHWLNVAARARYEAVARAFPGSSVRVYDASRDGEEVLAEVQSPVRPPAYYLTDLRAGRAMAIGQAYPQFAHVRFGTTRTIAYRTDKLARVNATVFLPPQGGQNLPLVVLAPGGPETGRPQRFDWLAQYLAVSGYAVLRPRRSWQGLAGRDSWAGTLRQWDGVSQGYALEGVRMLVKEGLVDPRRVCVIGVGYGGYAALAGAAFSPQTYACAVSINGISDLPAFMRYEINVFGGLSTPSAAATYWRAELGSTSDGKLIAESPVHAAAAVRAPVLLLHSVRDIAVPFAQSQEMANALSGLGKPVTLTRLAGVDQSLDRSATRVAVLRAIAPFLRRYLH